MIRNCFLFGTTVLLLGVVAVLVDGQCTSGEMENSASFELHRQVLDEIRNLRNDKCELSVNPTLPQDCADVRASGQTESGIYRIFLSLPGPLKRRIETDVYCDMDSTGNGWLVIQKRFDGSVIFNRNWEDYKHGFGNLTGEFWLGNDLLHMLSYNKRYTLRIDLEDYEGQKRFAEYKTFSVDSSEEKYMLTVSRYSGDAGDSLNNHNGMKFSTADSDNDNNGTYNCASGYDGAWWFNRCLYSHLNGQYLHGEQKFALGIIWKTFRDSYYLVNGSYYPLKGSQMKITTRL